jgi:hypothetical protein
MSADKKGLWVNIGGAPFDLNAGMIETGTNPPPGFVSKHRFGETDIAARINSIKAAVTVDSTAHSCYEHLHSGRNDDHNRY